MSETIETRETMCDEAKGTAQAAGSVAPDLDDYPTNTADTPADPESESVTSDEDDSEDDDEEDDDE